jgi:hypothetical protein
VVGEIGRSSRRRDASRGIDLELHLQRLLEVDDPDDVDDRDETTDDEGRDEDDLLLKLHAERGQDGQGEQQDGEVGEDVDGGR